MGGADNWIATGVALGDSVTARISCRAARLEVALIEMALSEVAFIEGMTWDLGWAAWSATAASTLFATVAAMVDWC